MVQERKTFFSLGGPTRFADPGEELQAQLLALAQRAQAQQAQQQQAQARLALQQASLRQSGEQFGQEFGLRQQGQEFGQQQALQKLALQKERDEALRSLSERQFGLSEDRLGLRRDELAQRGRQFVERETGLDERLERQITGQEELQAKRAASRKAAAKEARTFRKTAQGQEQQFRLKLEKIRAKRAKAAAAADRKFRKELQRESIKSSEKIAGIRKKRSKKQESEATKRFNKKQEFDRRKQVSAVLKSMVARNFTDMEPDVLAKQLILDLESVDPQDQARIRDAFLAKLKQDTTKAGGFGFADAVVKNINEISSFFGLNTGQLFNLAPSTSQQKGSLQRAALLKALAGRGQLPAGLSGAPGFGFTAPERR